MSLPWTDLITEIGKTVRQIIPDPQAQHDFDLKIMELAAQAEARENELILGQIETNKVEAANANLFVAGWRPFIGWTGGVALGYTWVFAPLLKMVFGLHDMPALDPGEIYPIIVGMLGLGTMRTVEKMRGVATSVNGTTPVPRHAIPADLDGLV